MNYDAVSLNKISMDAASKEVKALVEIESLVIEEIKAMVNTVAHKGYFNLDLSNTVIQSISSKEVDIVSLSTAIEIAFPDCSINLYKEKNHDNIDVDCINICW